MSTTVLRSDSTQQLRIGRIAKNFLFSPRPRVPVHNPSLLLTLWTKEPPRYKTLRYLHYDLLEPSPCLFEQMRIWHPKKYDLSRSGLKAFPTLIIVFLGCQLAQCLTAKNGIPIFRPTVQCEKAKSLFARKDRGSAPVDTRTVAEP